MNDKMRSWVMGMLLGQVSSPLPMTQKEPERQLIGYSYNGVVLPDINEVWTDKETYPYAYIVDMTAAVGFVAYQLTVANNVPYWTSSDGKVLFGWRYDGTVAKQYVYSPSIPDFANNFTFAADHTVSTGMTLGLFDEERSIGVPVWCNTDILNTDGSVNLAASDPVPVYE